MEIKTGDQPVDRSKQYAKNSNKESILIESFYIFNVPYYRSNLYVSHFTQFVSIYKGWLIDDQ